MASLWSSYLHDEETAISQDAIEGLLRLRSDLTLLKDPRIGSRDRVVISKTLSVSKEKVPISIVCGGGSGHEPAHAGFIGNGLLSAAVCGRIFASPGIGSFEAAFDFLLSKSQNVLVILKNYTGDRLHVYCALERLSHEDRSRIEVIVVGDDVPSRGMLDPNTGVMEPGRGVAGTLLVYKLAGALVAKNASFCQVCEIARKVSLEVRSAAFCLKPNIGNGSESAGWSTEFGVGIHGEPGRTVEPMSSVSSIVRTLIKRELNFPKELNRDKNSLPVRCAVLINPLGGLSNLEVQLVTGKILEEIGREYCALVAVGSILSSLRMIGLSVTVLPLDVGIGDESIEKLLQSQSVSIVQFPCFTVPSWEVSLQNGFTLDNAERVLEDSSGSFHPNLLMQCKVVSAALTRHREHLQELDRLAGDADFGEVVDNFAVLVKKFENRIGYPLSYKKSFSILSSAIQHEVGGSSGILGGIMLLRIASVLPNDYDSNIVDPMRSLSVWTAALEQGIEALQTAGNSGVGQSTVIDALCPALEAMKIYVQELTKVQHNYSIINNDNIWQDAISIMARASDQGALSTRNMVPRRGRARYVGERATHIEDVGARAAAVIFDALANIHY